MRIPQEELHSCRLQSIKRRTTYKTIRRNSIADGKDIDSKIPEINLALQTKQVGWGMYKGTTTHKTNQRNSIADGKDINSKIPEIRLAPVNISSWMGDAQRKQQLIKQFEEIPLRMAKVSIVKSPKLGLSLQALQGGWGMHRTRNEMVTLFSPTH